MTHLTLGAVGTAIGRRDCKIVRSRETDGRVGYSESMNQGSDEPAFDPAILAYYDGAWDEGSRLRSGINELELVRTREIVERFIPTTPLRILDIGGGAGIHSEWLLEAGHSVHMIDPVPVHVKQATHTLGHIPQFEASVGDGRSLAFDDGSFDVVLVFGPLYHLQSASDRLACWTEARRVTKPGGVIFGAVISRFASLFSGLSEGVIFESAFRDMVIQDLLDGRHTNPDGHDFFTTAYFHLPDEARSEPESVGLQVEALLGVEGIAAWIPRLEKSWSDPQRRQIIIDAARSIEAEPTLLGLGPHLIVVARP